MVFRKRIEFSEDRIARESKLKASKARKRAEKKVSSIKKKVRRAVGSIDRSVEGLSVAVAGSPVRISESVLKPRRLEKKIPKGKSLKAMKIAKKEFKGDLKF